MKRLFKFKYPKLALLALVIATSYFIFSNPQIQDFVSQLNGWGYFSTFIAGIFFTFGFTSPLSAGLFITLNPSNIWLAGILGGFGAMVGDLLIFQLIRFSFMDEFRRIKHTATMKKFSILMDNVLGHKIKVYVMYALAGFFIASPLPDEAGIIMMAGLTKIKPGILAICSLLLNSLGILILLAI